MKLRRFLRIFAWVLLLSLAVCGIPLAPVPLLRSEDPFPVTTELVEEREDEEQERDEIP